MAKKREEKNPVDKYKYTLLVTVAVIILAGSFVLFYQIQKQTSKTNEVSSSDELKNEIANLNKKIDDLNKELQSAREQSPTVETKTYTTTQKTTAKVAGDSTSNEQSVAGKININSASPGQLDSLPGIGPSYAQRIVDYRSANGGFKSIDEVMNVKGIGPKTFEKFKDLITI